MAKTKTVRYGIPIEQADDMRVRDFADMVRYDQARIIGERERFIVLETEMYRGPELRRWASFGITGIRFFDSTGYQLLPEGTQEWEARFAR